MSSQPPFSTTPDQSGFSGASSASSSIAGDALTVSNSSRILPMLWIGFYTTILNILTLTVFRFWGRTHFRRRLWSDTTIGGEPLEYTGRGLELFVGFVIAIFTVMIPTLLALILPQLFLPPAAMVVVVILVYLAMFVLIGAAIYLARRYHLSRTRFRGIRFAQTGSALSYGLAYLGYLAVTLITLGWYGPAAQIRLSKKLWSQAYFGNRPFQFEDTPEAQAEPVYKSFALAWFGGFLVYGGWIAVLLSTNVIENIDPAAGVNLKAIATLYGTAIIAGLIFMLFVCWHQAVITRRIIKSLKVDGLSLSSRFSTFDVIELAITNTLLLIFTLGFGFMAAQMRVWKRLANRMDLTGEVDFAAIEQTAEQGPKSGEGLADGLDLVSNF